MKYSDIKKITKLELTNSKLLKIKLIKFKIYEKNNYLKNINIEELELRLKKALYIIYLYCIHNKRILFVGGNSIKTYIQMRKLLKNTNHFIIPEKKWIPGVITNKKSFRALLNKQQKNIFSFSRNIFNIKKKPDLIVILDEKENKIALTEGYLSNTPVISLNSSLNLFNIYSDYKVPGNFSFGKKISQNNFFLALLVSILKKSHLTKLKNSFFLSYKLNTIEKLKKPQFYNYKRYYNKNNKSFNKKKYKKKFNKNFYQYNR